jgi:hypothetical protein
MEAKKDCQRVSDNVLLRIGGKPVWEGEDGHLTWIGEFTIDADGSPRCYGPRGTDPLDYLGNAGYPGNWWGVATDNRESYGKPIIQSDNDPWPGYYVSTTAYMVPGFYYSDPRAYLDSETVLFMVIPGNVRKRVRNICKGCKGMVTDQTTGKSMECVVGDIGPSTHLGEGSMALAEAFNVRSNPKNGGNNNPSRWRWECWPGEEMEGYELQR